MFSSVIITLRAFCSFFSIIEKSASKKQSTFFPENLYCTGNTSLLIIHYLILVIDTFKMHSVKIFGNKFLTQSQNFSLFKGFGQYIIPSAGLQNGDVVGFFILPDFIRNFHSLSYKREQFIIYMIDLFP